MKTLQQEIRPGKAKGSSRLAFTFRYVVPAEHQITTLDRALNAIDFSVSYDDYRRQKGITLSVYVMESKDGYDSHILMGDAITSGKTFRVRDCPRYSPKAVTEVAEALDGIIAQVAELWMPSNELAQMAILEAITMLNQPPRVTSSESQRYIDGDEPWAYGAVRETSPKYDVGELDLTATLAKYPNLSVRAGQLACKVCDSPVVVRILSDEVADLFFSANDVLNESSRKELLDSQSFTTCRCDHDDPDHKLGYRTYDDIGVARVSESPAPKYSALALLRDGIAAQLVGRDREAAIVTLALVAREHALLVGPPGTGKSQLCRAAASLIGDARYCERLLSPTTAPEAIWGPVSLSALRLDRYEHITAGYAADAHILYLDEVGRASPAILDTLLHLLGPERQALVGTAQIKSPLVAAIGSANTWPEDAAMLDRWTLRASVQYLPTGMRRDLLNFVVPIMTPVTTLADLEAANGATRSMGWSADANDTLDLILTDLDEAGIAISDRRLRSADKIARAAAVLRGGTEVQPGDLEPLQWVLWAIPEQAPVAGQKIVARANPTGARLDAILAEVDELSRAAVDAPTRLDAATKIELILKEAKTLASQPGANGRAAKVVKYVSNEHTRIQGAILGLSPDKIARLLA